MVIPGARLRPAGRRWRPSQQERCTSLYGVPTMFIAELEPPGLRVLRPLDAAHRDHGGLAVPGRGDEAGRRPDAHDRGHDLLRHDRDLARVDPDPHRRPLDRRVSTVGRVHPHVEVKIVDPETGPHVPRGEPGELCTRGYSVMLGYWDEPEKTAEAIDGARWMHTGDLARDGRRGLRQHRRPDQGHGHPRRRERLPARDRGVPLHPPGHRSTCRSSACPTSSTARSSWPGCELRDGAGRLTRRGGAGVLPRQARALQDPALRAWSSTSSR